VQLLSIRDRCPVPLDKFHEFLPVTFATPQDLQIRVDLCSVLEVFIIFDPLRKIMKRLIVSLTRRVNAGEAK